MTIKYEPVFGDQSLFDNAPEDAEYTGWFCQEVRWYMILNGKILFSDGGSWCTSDNPYLSADIAAMRRVIKTPTWTRADQEAGVLPPAGAKAMQCHEYCTVDILSVHHGYIVVCNSDIDDSRPVSFAIEKFIELFNPIETPEEKAKRLEDEFIDSLDLPAVYQSGARAAYRKLKGPNK